MSVAVTPGSGATVAADVVGTPSAPSSGQQIQYVKLDTGAAGASAPLAAGAGVPIYDGYLAPSTASWTSATALNTALTVATAGYDTVVVSYVPSGTITAGVVTFEVYDGAVWLPVKASRIESYATEGSYTLTGGTRGWQLPVAGFPQFRIRLSTGITGSGTAVVTAIVSSAPDTSVVTVGLDPAQPLPAGTNAIGTVSTLPPSGSYNDASGTVTTGGTSQQALAANANRKALVAANLDASEYLYLNFGSAAGVAAAGSVPLPPNSTFIFDSHVSTQTVNVVAATTGHKFTVKEM